MKKNSKNSNVRSANSKKCANGATKISGKPSKGSVISMKIDRNRTYSMREIWLMQIFDGVTSYTGTRKEILKNAERLDLTYVESGSRKRWLVRGSALIKFMSRYFKKPKYV